MANFRERLHRLMAKLQLKCSGDPIIKSKNEETLVPSGFLLVHVGEERRRYLVPITNLSFRMFQALLNQFGVGMLAKEKEPITFPCSTQMFEWVPDLVKAEKLAPHELDFLFTGSSRTRSC